jgi:hypothetical protein
VDEIALPEDFYDLGNHFAEDLYEWARRAVPLSKSYNIALQRGKERKTSVRVAG